MYVIKQKKSKNVFMSKIITCIRKNTSDFNSLLVRTNVNIENSLVNCKKLAQVMTANEIDGVQRRVKRYVATKVY